MNAIITIAVAGLGAFFVGPFTGLFIAVSGYVLGRKV